MVGRKYELGGDASNKAIAMNPRRIVGFWSGRGAYMPIYLVETDRTGCIWPEAVAEER